MSNRTEDMSWPAPPDASHSYTVGFAAQVAELVVAKMKDEGLVRDDRPLLTVEEVAARLAVSERLLGDMYRGVDGKPPVLASVQVGTADRRGVGVKGVRFEPAEIDRYIEQQRRLALAKASD